MPSLAHKTDYAIEALSLLTSRYSKPRPDAPPVVAEDEMALVKTTAVDADATITSGDTAAAWLIYQAFSGLTAARILNLPAPSTCKGVRVIARVLDNSLSDDGTIKIIWTPASGSIERANTSAATLDQTKAVSGVNGSLEFLSDGSVWRALT